MTTWTAGEIGLNGPFARLCAVGRAGTLDRSRGSGCAPMQYPARAKDGGVVSTSVVSSMAGSYAACATAAADLDLAGQARHGLHLAVHPGLFAFIGQVNDDAGE